MADPVRYIHYSAFQYLYGGESGPRANNTEFVRVPRLAPPKAAVKIQPIIPRRKELTKKFTWKTPLEAEDDNAEEEPEAGTSAPRRQERPAAQPMVSKDGKLVTYFTGYSA